MHKAVAFLAPKKTRKFEDFYKEWIDVLDATLLPVLNGSSAGITEAFLVSHVDRIHRHFQNYYTAMDAAVISCPHRHLPLLLHPPWFSPLQVPVLFLGDLHPFLFTTLLRSFVLDRDDEDGETDLDEDGLWSEMKSPASEYYYHEEGHGNEEDARAIHDVHWRMATAWKRPSGVLISRIGEMERWVRRMVPDLTSRVRASQHRFAEQLGKRLDRCEEDGNGNGLGVREAAEEEMKEMVTAFVEGNRLRRSVMEEVMRATDAYQAASYFQALGQFIVGLTDKKLDSRTHSRNRTTRKKRKMSLALQSPPSSSSLLRQDGKRLSSKVLLPPLRLAVGDRCNGSLHVPTLIRASRNSSSVETGLRTELDLVSGFSEIVPASIILDDIEKFPPTAVTVCSSLLLEIFSLPDMIFRNAVEMALADTECNRLENNELRLSCFANKALVNVGGDMAKLVPGRVTTEVDARLAYDTLGIIRKVRDLLKLYGQIGVPPERLLFKIPATWQGIEASRLLESEGIQTHLTFVYSFAQAAAAAQAGTSVIQIFVGRIRDWARNHSGDPEIDAALRRGEDPGLSLITRAYNYIHKYGHKSKLMAAAVRNKQDLFSLLGVDYIIAPLKVLQSLKDSVTAPDEKYSFIRRLSPESAANYNFSQEELMKWDQLSLASAMGPASVHLLAAGLDGHVTQAKRVEELFGKIWPPPNV